MVRFIKGIFNHEPDNISLNFIAGYRFFKAIEVAKLCKNFVLLELKTAFKHSPKEHDTVKNLIQELIDQIIDPDTFRRRLREAFNFKDFLQLYHFAFLENHVTELRKSLMSGQISINGIISPANNVTQNTQTNFQLAFQNMLSTCKPVIRKIHFTCLEKDCS